MTLGGYGYGWVARQISRVGSALLVNQHQDKILQLVYTLKTLGLVNKQEFWITERMTVLPEITTPGVHCVVLWDNSVLYNYDVQLFTNMIQSKQFLLLVCTSQVGTVPPFYLHYLPCMLWNMGRYVHIPWIASMYHVVNRFMMQERSALLHHGDVFLDVTTDCCMPVHLVTSRYYGVVVRVMNMQAWFRKKRTAVVTLQRYIKQWVYRPDAALGHKIIQSLQENGVPCYLLY